MAGNRLGAVIVAVSLGAVSLVTACSSGAASEACNGAVGEWATAELAQLDVAEIRSDAFDRYLDADSGSEAEAVAERDLDDARRADEEAAEVARDALDSVADACSADNGNT